MPKGRMQVWASPTAPAACPPQVAGVFCFNWLHVDGRPNLAKGRTGGDRPRKKARIRDTVRVRIGYTPDLDPGWTTASLHPP